MTYFSSLRRTVTGVEVQALVAIMRCRPAQLRPVWTLESAHHHVYQDSRTNLSIPLFIELIYHILRELRQRLDNADACLQYEIPHWHITGTSDDFRKAREHVLRAHVVR